MEVINSKKRKILMILFLFFILTAAPLPVFADHRFTILHTNDSHSALRPHSSVLDYHPGKKDGTRGGFARLAGLIESERKKRTDRGEEVFVISAGDFHGGDPYAWLSLIGKAPELRLMNKIGYDLVTAGNHEYDYGPGQLADYLGAAGYPDTAEELPILASNTVIPSEHPLTEKGIKDFVIRETDSGLKIGFLGLIGNGAISVAHKTDPLEFTDPIEEAGRMVAALEERGTEVIIAVSHSGLEEDKRLARKIEGIDIIVGGHSHHALEDRVEIGGTIIVQSGYRLENLGILELNYISGEDRVEVLNERNGQPYLVEINDSLEEDPDIAAAVANYTVDLNNYLTELTDGRYIRLEEPALSLDYPLPALPEKSETRFGNFLTDALRLGVEDITGKPVDFAFQANGLIRRGLKPGTTPRGSGKISFYQLAAAAGLGTGPDQKPGYPLVESYLTGTEVRNILEISVLLSELWGNNYFLQNSGVRYRYDPRRTILFNIPVIDRPIPTGRAVISAERYTGPGIQSDSSEGYRPLPGKEKRLYRVITDYYLLQFLPRVGDAVPGLELQLKNEKGVPLENPEEAIIRHGGGELKVWQALFHYAGMQEGGGGREKIHFNSAYRERGNRIISVRRFSLLATPGIIIFPVVLLIVLLIYRFIIRRKQID